MDKRKRIIFHISFWLILYFSSDILSFLGEKSYTFQFGKYQNPLHYSSWFLKLMVTYLILFFFNKYLGKKLYIQLILSFLVVCGIYVALRYSIEEILFFKWFGFHNYSEESRQFPYYFTDNVYNVISYSFYAFFLKMIEDFFINEREKTSLLTEKLNAEQAFLKNQLNPHFLFNTLNNIYSLTLNKSEKAPEAVLKLSELMRYMLYESNIEKVNLATEVKYLENFIELQKYRYAGKTYINFEVVGNLNQYKIAPLLLISFVENAFKHGEVNIEDKPLNISLLINENNLNFTVKNYKKDQYKDELGGIGLENVKRRLQLIYPNNHSLEVKETADTYFCELNLIL
jgi:two-component system, LytTR family, sensor kinase